MNVLRLAALLGLVIVLLLAGVGYNYRVSHHLAAPDNSPATIYVPHPDQTEPYGGYEGCKPQPDCRFVGMSVP